MRADYIQKIEALASTFPNRNVTLYFPDFEDEPAADSLNQVFGTPVGVRADNWPIFAGLPALLEQIGEELEAGAWKVIAEGREAGTAGIYRPTGELRTGLVDEIEHSISFHDLI